MGVSLIFGIGMSAVWGFIRYRIPTLSKPFSEAGLAVGLAFMVLSFVPQIRLSVIVLGAVGIACIVAAISLHLHAGPTDPAPPVGGSADVIISQGGAGGSATAGPGGIAIGGPGGHSGGLPGRGGDGGGKGSIGDVVVGGGGGSVDGPDIWYPPAPNGYEVYMRAQGKKPEPEMKRFGRSGMSPGYAQKYAFVEGLRAQYFEAHKLRPDSPDENIYAMPLAELNKALEGAGQTWRAQIVDDNYVFFVPKDGR